MKIIDTHTHIYPEAIAAKAAVNLGNFYNFPILGGGTQADLEKTALSCGVTGFFFLAVATNAHQVEKVNDNMAESVALSRSRGFECWGFGGMHQEFSDFAAEVDRIGRIGLSGIKIHPDIQRFDLSDKRMYELCEILEGRMPLFLHVGDERAEYRFSEPKKVAALSDRFPRLQIVAAHFGGYKAWDEGECLYGRPNLWYDCSSALWAMDADQAMKLFEKCGFDRVMYGTDYPVYTLSAYLDLFDRLPLDDAQRQAILYDNAKRFIEA